MKNARKLNEAQVRQLVRKLVAEIADTRGKTPSRPDVALREFAAGMKEIHEPHGISVELSSGIDNVTGLMRDTMSMVWNDDYSGQTVVMTIYSQDNGYMATVEVEENGSVRNAFTNNKPMRSPNMAFSNLTQKIAMSMHGHAGAYDDVLVRFNDLLDSP